MSVCIKGSTEAHLLAMAERLQDKRAIEMQQHNRLLPWPTRPLAGLRRFGAEGRYGVHDWPPGRGTAHRDTHVAMTLGVVRASA